MKSRVLFLLLSVALFAQEANSLKWWKHFGDTTLVGVVDYGIANNKNLQASKKRTDQAMEQAKLNRSLLFPNLYANGRWNGGDLNGSTMPGANDKDMMNSASVSLDARYNISSLGEEMQQYKVAQRAFEAQAQDHLDAELRSSIQIVKLYFDAVYSKGQIAILAEQKATAEQLLKLTQMRYSKGQTSGLALLQQKQQLASVEASIPPAQLQYQNSVEYLAAITFLSIDTLYSLIPDTLPVLEETIESDFTIEHRPDLAAAQLRTESAKAAFNKAKLTLVPDVAITGSAGWDYGDPGSAQWENMWNVGAQISMPIFTGGAIVSGYREGRNGYDAAVASKEQAWSDAEAQLTNSLTEERSYRAQVNAYSTQFEASQAVYDESLRQYRNGLVEYIEVLASINALQQSEIILLGSTRNLLQARLNIVLAIGGVLPASLN